jgi:hypothetical protein
MWVIPDPSPIMYALQVSRWEIVSNTLNGLIMGCVIVNTYRHSKLPYLYTVASMFFIGPIFVIVAYVFIDWPNFCYYYSEDNSKCPEDPSHNWYANLSMMFSICNRT